MKNKYFNICLSNLRFYAYIGLLEHEQRIGNNFTVNVELTIDASPFREEDLSSSISYADVYEVVKEEMEKKRKLLESVALSISDTIKARWDVVLKSSVSITKEFVPVHGFNGQGTVELVCDYD